MSGNTRERLGQSQVPTAQLLHQHEPAIWITKHETLVAACYLARNQALFPANSNRRADHFELITGCKTHLVAPHDPCWGQVYEYGSIRGHQCQMTADFTFAHGAVKLGELLHYSLDRCLVGTVVEGRSLSSDWTLELHRSSNP